MMLLCGHFVGHNPDGALNWRKKAERDKTTRKALEVRFANKYDKEVWNAIVDNMGRYQPNLNEGITITIKDQNGEETMFRINRGTKLGKVFHLFAQRKGIEYGQLFFLLDGERISETETPSSLELEDEDQIDAILRQCGC